MSILSPRTVQIPGYVQVGSFIIVVVWCSRQYSDSLKFGIIYFIF